MRPALAFARHAWPRRLGFPPLLVVTGDAGVCRIAFDADEDAVVGELVETKRPRLVKSLAATSDVRRELDEYFRGRRRAFDVAVDLSELAPFRRKVLETLRARVAFGKTVSYGELALLARKPGAARAVGGAVGINPVPIVVPCHRVIAADGSLGGFGAGPARKRALLEIEGIRGLRGGWHVGRAR